MNRKRDVMPRAIHVGPRGREDSYSEILGVGVANTETEASSPQPSITSEHKDLERENP